MCDLGLVLGLSSTFVGAAAQKKQADAQAESDQFNAKVLDMNATMADRKARDALARGRVAEQEKRQEVSQVMGKQRASMAANGVDISFGSPLDLLVDTATLGEIDAQTIRKNAANEAYDYKLDGMNNRSQASLSRASAKSAKTGGFLAAAGTVLSGAGKAYSTAYSPYSPYSLSYIGRGQ